MGKTSLLQSYADQKFSNNYKATIGADFLEKEILANSKIINLVVLQNIFRSGTQLGNKSSGASDKHFIEVPIAVYSYLISRIKE